MSKNKKSFLVEGIPAALASAEVWSRALRLPQVKQTSEKFCSESTTYPITFSAFRSAANNQTIIHRARTDAATMAYLRAVVALSFTANQVSIRIIQAMENILKPEELVGVLMMTYLGLKASFHEDIIYFREEGATHMLEGPQFVNVLNQTLRFTGQPQLLIVNVHHDYLTIHHNLSDLNPILQTICGIKQSPKLK